MLVLIFLMAAIAIGLLMLGVMTPHKSSSKGRARPAGNLDREFVARKWETIESLSSGTGSSLKDAVSEADKLLDYALKRTGARGETMGERLKNSGSRFSDVNSIWSAHKVRNALAHEADFDLVPSQAREAVAHFKQGLKDLGAL